MLADFPSPQISSFEKCEKTDRFSAQAGEEECDFGHVFPTLLDVCNSLMTIPPSEHESLYLALKNAKDVTNRPYLICYLPQLTRSIRNLVALRPVTKATVITIMWRIKNVLLYK